MRVTQQRSDLLELLKACWLVMLLLPGECGEGMVGGFPFWRMTMNRRERRESARFMPKLTDAEHVLACGALRFAVLPLPVAHAPAVDLDGEDAGRASCDCERGTLCQSSSAWRGSGEMTRASASALRSDWFSSWSARDAFASVLAWSRASSCSCR